MVAIIIIASERLNRHLNTNSKFDTFLSVMSSQRPVATQQSLLLITHNPLAYFLEMI